MSDKIKMHKIDDNDLDKVSGGSYYDGPFAGYHAQCRCPVHGEFLVTKDDLIYLRSIGNVCPGDNGPCGQPLQIRTDPSQPW
ncbi:MAG: hypothetical protein K5888_09520 [Lachnospiraceae bacterium]|nr:hypothetical protein [Lachnospiraceae bacterium]